jgi:hypothetical protein
MNDKIIKPQLINVPFKASSSNGMTEYEGIAKFSPAGIVVEFESKFLGLIGGEVKEVQVAMSEILDIKFRKGIYKFFGQIQLRLKNYAKISQLPNDSGKVKLNIKREDYELAHEAFEQTLQYISGNEPLTLQESNDLNEQLPPAQTSVNDLFDTEKLTDKNSRETNRFDKNTN